MQYLTSYSHASPTQAEEQAKDKQLRTRSSGQPFEPLSLKQSGMNAWLKANTICGSIIATPGDLKDAIRTLESLLGDPVKPIKKDSNDFARISTVRIKSRYSTSGPVRRTTYKLGERYDYSVQNRHHSPFVNFACADIVREFLRISGYGSFLQALLNQEDEADGHRVYAHVDWYPRRTYQAEDWHKDTHGSTLFVGLIYLNQGEIQGPDVISNPWPLDLVALNPTSPKKEPTLKARAPCVLPPSILDPINEILMENWNNGKTKMKIRQTGKVPAGGGMVWFIDELIHHRTPQAWAIKKGHEMKMSIGGSALGKFKEGTVEPAPDQWVGFGVGEPRSFVRIWVTLDKVTPKVKVVA